MPRNKKTTPLTPEQRKLVGDNIALVRWFVNRWLAQHRPHRSSRYYDDAIQAATVGMCRAAQTWDSSARGGCAFSTYAINAMTHAVCRHFDEDSLIRRPLFKQRSKTRTFDRHERKRAARVGSMESADGSKPEFVARDPSPLNRAIQNEVIRMVRSGLIRISANQREAVVEFMETGSDMMLVCRDGVSRTAIQNRRLKGMENLRRLLRRLED